jgi:hypothetical protein
MNTKMTQEQWRELSLDDRLRVFSKMTRAERNALKLLEEGDNLMADDEAQGLFKPRPAQPALI